jgi:hypothetical protein
MKKNFDKTEVLLVHLVCTSPHCWQHESVNLQARPGTRLILWRTGVEIDQLRGESYIMRKVMMCTFTE